MQIGGFVGGVTALGGGASTNQRVAYSVVGGANSSYFTVDSNTGVITAQKVLLRTQGTLLVYIQATAKVTD